MNRHRPRATRRTRWNRWLYRLHARHYGYFWLPCPICGYERSGWEWHRDGGPSIPVIGSPREGHGVCGPCAHEGEHRRYAYDDTLGKAVPRPGVTA